MNYETHIVNPGVYNPDGADAALRSLFPEKYAGLIGEGTILLRLIFLEALSPVEEQLVLQAFEDNRLETIMQYEVTFDMEVKE